MDECPGCDGTITRAVQQGREITTYERCQRCEEREKALLDRFRDAIIPGPPPVVVGPLNDEPLATPVERLRYMGYLD